MRLRERVSAALAVSELETAFYETVAVGDRFWWWLRMIFLDPNEIICDDGYDQLYRVPFTVTNDDPDAPLTDRVEFGEPSPVRIEYVDQAPREGQVAAAVAAMATIRGEKVAAKYWSREETRPQVRAKGGSVDLNALRQSLGLDANTPDDEVIRVAAERVAQSGGEEQEPATTPEVQEPGAEPPPGQGNGEGQEEQQTPGEQSGTVQVDREALTQLQASVRELSSERVERLKREDADVVLAAIKKGKFPKSREQHYLSLMEKDREGTRKFIEELAENVIPIEARGEAHTGEQQLGVDAPGYPAHWLPDVQRRKEALAANGRPRVMTDAPRPGTVQGAV